jgi:hypothetical protein
MGLLRLLQLQLRHLRGARAPRDGGGGSWSGAQIKRAGLGVCRRGPERPQVHGFVAGCRAARVHGAFVLAWGDGAATAVQVYPGFVVALVASTILTAFYGILLVLSLFTRGAALEAASLVLQCAAHPLALRLYWLAAPALTALLAGTTIARLASGSGTMRSRWWC